MIIHIFGASGSGTSTLGSAICEDFGAFFMDTDDYFWLPTNPRFTTKRPRDERLALINADFDSHLDAVLSGALSGWGDELIPRFDLAIRLVTDKAVRIERLKAREFARFGERIREGGDMHEQHLAFLEWAAKYDDGDTSMRSAAEHDQWQKQLPCPLLVLDGANPTADNIAEIKRFLRR